MADNVAITAGSGTSIATDDIGGVQYQRVKLGLGADGTAVDAVAGAGVVGTGVQRITLASDDPAVALLTTMDADTGAMVADLAAIEVLLTTQAGNLDGIETLIGTTNTALAIIDDWDESDRAKVNLIVGQAGIAAGAGAVGVTVPRVTLASDDPAVVALQILDNAISGSEMQVDVVAALPTGTNSIGAVTNTHLTNALVGDYETVAASQTNQVLGPTGATGDYLSGVLIVPATTSPGNVIILDNATSITIFTGGTDSVSNLVPFMVPLGMLSVSGSWRITTGANVSAIGIGNFT
jgi:hypothetical protein